MGSVINADGRSDENVVTAVAGRGTWAIEYPRDQLPDLPLDQVLWFAFEHFAHLDLSNAPIHCASVRWSPITFRLADQLDAMNVYDHLLPLNAELLREVMQHRGQYEEDTGR